MIRLCGKKRSIERGRKNSNSICPEPKAKTNKTKGDDLGGEDKSKEVTIDCMFT